MTEFGSTEEALAHLRVLSARAAANARAAAQRRLTEADDLYDFHRTALAHQEVFARGATPGETRDLVERSLRLFPHVPVVRADILGLSAEVLEAAGRPTAYDVVVVVGNVMVYLADGTEARALGVLAGGVVAGGVATLRPTASPGRAPLAVAAPGGRLFAASGASVCAFGAGGV